MIWVVLWALGVVAFLVYFFRTFGGVRGFLLSVLGLVVLLASGFLQKGILEEYSSYNAFVGAVSAVGWSILILAVAVFLSGLIAGVMLTLRYGQSGDQQHRIITENRSLSAVSLLYPPLTGRSKRRILASKSDLITMESIVNGTATFAERMLMIDIIILFVTFFLIWLGLGLIMMKNLLILVLIPVLPGLWVYYNLRAEWEEYRRAKQDFAARRPGS